MGIPLEDLREILCVEVPDTPWGRAYQAYIIAIDSTLFLPVMVSNVDDYTAAGANRLRDFNRAMVVAGKPCHFARVSRVVQVNDGES